MVSARQGYVDIAFTSESLIRFPDYTNSSQGFSYTRGSSGARWYASLLPVFAVLILIMIAQYWVSILLTAYGTTVLVGSRKF